MDWLCVSPRTPVVKPQPPRVDGLWEGIRCTRPHPHEGGSPGCNQHPHKRKRKISLAFSLCAHAPRKGRVKTRGEGGPSARPRGTGIAGHLDHGLPDPRSLFSRLPALWYLFLQPERSDTGGTEKIQTPICLDSRRVLSLQPPSPLSLDFLLTLASMDWLLLLFCMHF